MATTRERTRDEAIILAHEAKHPVSVVAGPYGHPFHPILVTVPIGAWMASLVFDIATRVQSGGSASLVDASFWLIGLGIVSALAAAIFGFLDLIAIPRRTSAFRAGLLHMGLNLIIVALFAVNFLWRAGEHAEASEVEVGQLVLTAVAVALLAVSGWLGGKLAYRFGVRVAEDDTQAEGFRSSTR